MAVQMIVERRIPYGASMYMGDPDGPLRFIKSLGLEVPTYIAPREDLRTQYRNAGAHISVDYHVPSDMRGPYYPQDLADFDQYAEYPLTRTGKTRCGGLKPDGQICQKSAMNRTGFCTNHGGALHPADKLFASERGIMPSDPTKLNRLQKVEMGVIPVRELDDEEIAKQQVRNDDGTYSKSTPVLAARIVAQMRSEFFARADRFVRENAMQLMEEMRNIALSNVAEDKDKIQAITWLTERALGKTPDVLLTATTELPIDQMIADVTGGSRDAWRSNEAFTGQVVEGAVVNVLDDESDDDGPESNEQPLPLGWCKECKTNCDGMHVISGGNDEVQGQVEARPNVGANSGVVDIAKARKEAKDRIRRHRNRKYAAKAQGSATLDNLAFHLEFKVVELASGPVTRMKIITPEAMKAPRMR